jgi:integrin alpha FG-GAP repeat containing protein 1
MKNELSTTEYGTNYRYIVTDISGTRRMDVSFQLAQTSELALNLPYAYIGLGRSNNYIENFHVISNTFTVSRTDSYYIYTPVIPNSQLIISKDYNSDSNKVYNIIFLILLYNFNLIQ